jgi:L-iditol 2-dehydrogenase
MMKAGVLENIQCLRFRNIPEPELLHYSAIIKVKVCGICGTDLRTYRYGHSKVTLPHVLGHEISGEIIAVDNSVKGYHTGQRVAVTPRISCGTCYYCLHGQPLYCENSRTFGFQLQGGYAEYMLVPERGIRYGVLNTIPETLGFEEASLAEPVSCCLRAQRTCNVGPGTCIVVIGGGAMGIMHCRIARANKADTIILVDRNTDRLERISCTSIDMLIDSRKEDAVTRIMKATEGRGADVVIVACSSGEAQVQAISLAGKGSRINLFGGLPPDNANILINSNDIHYREIMINSTHGSLPSDNMDALEIMANKELQVLDLLSDLFPVEEIETAFERAASRQTLHVGICP